MVIVPVEPGPIVALGDRVDDRDEIDAVLDELFGPVDTGGPTKVDVILLAIGAAVVVAGLTRSSAALVVVGAILVLLGAVLPVRSLWHSFHARRDHRATARLSELGEFLRTDDDTLAELIAAYGGVMELAAESEPSISAEVTRIAHEAVFEVASLLDADLPETEMERAYVERRSVSLRGLAATLTERRVIDEDGPDRGALLAAREELEALTGSAVDRLDDLRRRLATPEDG